ncbi:MAG: hypothetical protein AAFN93_19615 [Bacteroidota bacterium]
MDIERRREKLKHQIVDLDLSNWKQLCLAVISSKSSIFNDFLVLGVNASKLENQLDLGTIGDDLYSKNRTQSISGALNLIDRLEHADLNPSIIQGVGQEEINKSDYLIDEHFEKRVQLLGLTRKLSTEEGIKIYEKEYKLVTSLLITKLQKYCDLGYHKLQKKVHKDKTHVIKIDEVTLKISPCIDISKRFIWINISDNPDDSNLYADEDGRVGDDENRTIDSLSLEYDRNFALVWENSEMSLQFFSDELAQLILKRIFSILIRYEFEYKF